MRWFRRLIALTIITLFTAGTIDINAGTVKKSGPILNNGAKWRIGFCQSEPYQDYASNFYYIIKGLEEAGWVSGTEDLPFKTGQDDTEEMWNWLAARNVSQYLEFVKDSHYDLKKMSSRGAAGEKQIIKRLQSKKDIDLMIVTGTAAGLVLSKGDHSVPTLVFSTSDPVGSGIIKSATDSGKDNVWAHVDQGQFRRQVQVFHDIFKFKKMGLVYEDSELGRSYIALNDIENIAKERGFQLISYHVKEPVNSSDEARYYRDLRAAYQGIAGEIDAMLLTVSPTKPEMLAELLTPFYKRRIPVFSQGGALEVKYGALMSVTQNDYQNLQKFAAGTIADVFHGAKPGKLPQIFESTPRIILNLEVARIINYKPSFDILYVADEIYRKIAKW